MTIDTSSIQWYGHDCFCITAKDGTVLYVDPYQLPVTAPKADVILITHEHFDHCSPDDIGRVFQAATTICGSAKVAAALTEEVHVMASGDRAEIQSITVVAVPAYNQDKFRSPGVPFHPSTDNSVGYLITIDGVTYYHTGDTDVIPEMKDITADIMFVPVSGVYVMNAAEAVEAVALVKPQLAIPMHYGAIVGSMADAEQFSKRSSVPVKILPKTEA